MTAIRRIDVVKPQLDDLAKRLVWLEDVPDGLVDDLKQLVARIDTVRARFVRPEGTDETGARLLDKIRSL